MSRLRRRATHLLALTATLWLLFVPAASAYIDAGSTAVVFQSIVAGIAAGGMFLKLYWRRLKAFFGRGDDDAVDRTTDGVTDDAGATEVTAHATDVDGVGDAAAADTPVEHR